MSIEDSARFENSTTREFVSIDAATAAPKVARQPKKKRVTATPILHFLSTQEFASPFDINMAVDAGYRVVVPHINVKLANTAALVQDAIFSRPPHFGCRTGLFIGGKDAMLALDMLDAAKAALVPPFQLSALADPGGSFTTAAAMVACVENVFKRETKRSLEGATVAVFGATGVVGFAAAIICALSGAKVKVITHIGLDAIQPTVKEAKRRFGVKLEPVIGARDSDKVKILAGVDIALCAAAAGVRVLKDESFAKVKRPLVVADVNAVPPSGIEGVELFDMGKRFGKKPVWSVGPLAIGDIKYKTQSALLRRMTQSEASLFFDFNDAFTMARDLVAKANRKFK